MIIYRGRRTPEGAVVTRSTGTETDDEDDAPLGRELPLRLDLWNHSPAGFEWGYGGSGPAQLALALLADALGDDGQAVRLHQAFKWEVVSRLPRDGWTLNQVEVKRVAQALAQRAQAEQEGKPAP